MRSNEAIEAGTVDGFDLGYFSMSCHGKVISPVAEPDQGAQPPFIFATATARRGFPRSTAIVPALQSPSRSKRWRG